MDPVLVNDWHPVAAASALGEQRIVPATLFGTDLALWRGADGAVRAWQDRCPHRGTRLSIGRIEDDALVCAYHGWRFSAEGRCIRIPALPGFEPPASACAKTYSAQERYGLVWACVGNPAADILPFPECADPNLRQVVCGPYDVCTAGPRIIENFLDMTHFGFVHEGILGDRAHTEVRDYEVGPYDDGQGGAGLLATGCFAWQPQTNSLAHGGTDVEYTYRVVRPLTAILTKLPQAQQGFREAISLHVQPIGEEQSRVWMILAMTNFEQPESELRAFQDRIFLQDKPVLENQVPKRLPLATGAETSMRCDRMSVAYRRYLSERGMRFGVLAA